MLTETKTRYEVLKEDKLVFAGTPEQVLKWMKDGDLKGIEVREEAIYEVQDYNVVFQVGVVNIEANVYHEDKSKLTRAEIIEEAIGYVESINVEVSARNVIEIKQLSCE